MRSHAAVPGVGCGITSSRARRVAEVRLGRASSHHFNKRDFMSRLIRHEAVGPIELPPQEKSAWICACGLSQNLPHCDGSHSVCRKTEEDGKLYVYDKARKNVAEVMEDNR